MDKSEVIKFAIASIDRNILPKDILSLEGMSSVANRRLLNTLGFFSQNYLEIGVWKGSTLIATLFANSHLSATAIEDWSQFDGPAAKNVFLANCCKHIGLHDLTLIEQDCFKVDLSNLKGPFDLFFYDGNHDNDSQRKCFHHFQDILSDELIFVVDDWNWKHVEVDTLYSVGQSNYEVVSKTELRSAEFHNGICLFHLSKIGCKT